MATASAVCGAFGFAACGNDGGDNGKEHTHDYGINWVTDKNDHWHECKNGGCDEKIKDKAAHSDGDENGMCDVCGYQITVIPAVHTHNLTLVAAKEAGCVTDGNIAYYTCDGCDKWFADGNGKSEITDKSSVVIVKGHELTPVAAKKADCTAEGNIAYYTCGGCDKWFEDGQGKNEITDKSSVVIEKEKHELTPVAAKEADCTTDGNIAYYTCDGCNKWFEDEQCKNEIKDKASVVIAKGHKLTPVAAKAPTCIADGNLAYFTCDVCLKWYKDGQAKTELTDKTSVVITERAEHDYVDKVCSVCGDLQPTEGIEYTEYDDYCEVFGIGTATDTDIVIASTYNGKPVTEVRNFAFKDCNTVTGMTVPSSVTKIGSEAFRNCKNLKEITILCKDIESLSQDTFMGCTSLVTARVPATIGYGLKGRTSLRTLIINGGDYIWANAFAGCNSLSDVTIPDYITNIEGGAFNMTPIVSATMPAHACPYIRGGSTFGGVAYLTYVTITSGDTIPDESFKNCNYLKSVELPDSITSIGREAFYGCTNLTNLDLPEGVSSVGDYAFHGCYGLEYEEYDNGMYFGNDNPYLILVKTKTLNSPLTSCIINENTKFIHSNVFEMRGSLTEITIPDGVVSIGARAFRASGLTSIAIPDSVKYIGDEAFGECSVLEVEGGVQYVDKWVLSCDTSLKQVTLREGTKVIGERAFSVCDLTEIIIPGRESINDLHLAIRY